MLHEPMHISSKHTAAATNAKQSRQARHYYERKRQHMCVSCRNHARPGKVHCKECAVITNEASKRRYKKLAAALAQLRAIYVNHK